MTVDLIQLPEWESLAERENVLQRYKRFARVAGDDVGIPIFIGGMIAAIASFPISTVMLTSYAAGMGFSLLVGIFFCAFSLAVAEIVERYQLRKMIKHDKTCEQPSKLIVQADQLASTLVRIGAYDTRGNEYASRVFDPDEEAAALEYALALEAAVEEHEEAGQQRRLEAHHRHETLTQAASRINESVQPFASQARQGNRLLRR